MKTIPAAIDSDSPEFNAAMDGMYRYSIVRHYQNGGKRTIVTGLNLRQAQAHCRNPETSSSTCMKYAGRARTRRLGAWFDGYTDK